MTEEEIAAEVVDAALEVHRELGPGLLESVYEKCLAFELKQREIDVQRQVEIPVYYKELEMNFGFRADLIIENKFIVEVKSSERLADIHLAQILTYLKLTDIRIGLLINFNVPLIKNGIRRVIYGR